MDKLFLHTCCGPCAMWPLEDLRNEGRKVHLFFFNPNIHPLAEWERRRDNARKAAEFYGVPLTVLGSSDEEEWIKRAGEGQERCRYCYRVRLMQAAEEARKRGFTAFSSTLLVSPWQKRDLIIEEGERAARETGISFLPYDWREGYRQGQALAREAGLYRQRYCGCLISLDESSYAESIRRDHRELSGRAEGSSGLE